MRVRNSTLIRRNRDGRLLLQCLRRLHRCWQDLCRFRCLSIALRLTDLRVQLLRRWLRRWKSLVRLGGRLNL